MSCKPVTTHHNACDRREDHFRTLEAENATLREALERISVFPNDVPSWPYSTVQNRLMEIAKEALSKCSEKAAKGQGV